MSRRSAAPPVWLLAAALAGCGAAGGGAGPDVDSTLVDALAEVHLAEARAALSDSTGGAGRTGGRGGAADSLRAVALAAHGLDAEALDRSLDRLARDPALAEATYAAVAERLRWERRDGPAPSPF